VEQCRFMFVVSLQILEDFNASIVSERPSLRHYLSTRKDMSCHLQGEESPCLPTSFVPPKMNTKFSFC
jgi:hypothetical protein